MLQQLLMESSSSFKSSCERNLKEVVANDLGLLSRSCLLTKFILSSDAISLKIGSFVTHRESGRDFALPNGIFRFHRLYLVRPHVALFASVTEGCISGLSVARFTHRRKLYYKTDH